MLLAVGKYNIRASPCELLAEDRVWIDFMFQRHSRQSLSACTEQAQTITSTAIKLLLVLITTITTITTITNYHVITITLLMSTTPMQGVGWDSALCLHRGSP